MFVSFKAGKGATIGSERKGLYSLEVKVKAKVKVIVKCLVARRGAVYHNKPLTEALLQR